MHRYRGIDSTQESTHGYKLGGRYGADSINGCPNSCKNPAPWRISHWAARDRCECGWVRPSPSHTGSVPFFNKIKFIFYIKETFCYIFYIK